MNWTMKLCVPLASAAILVGCTQEVDTDPDQNRTPIDHATNRERQNLQISLTGCVGTGPGTNQYVLTHVKPAPLGTQPSDAITSANLDFSKNSAVRLASNDEQELTSLVGQTISVVGVLRDDGRNTIGTSGNARPAPGASEPRTDSSQAATDQHHSEKVREEAGPIGNRSMNNGSYPEIMVQQVTPTGEQCEPNPVPDRR
jgi:type 1 fimbria pilin